MSEPFQEEYPIDRADKRSFHTAQPQLKRLAIVDQLLAVWIILAMGLGLIIGNFSSAAEVLEQVKFVDVSLPLGKLDTFALFLFPRNGPKR